MPLNRVRVVGVAGAALSLVLIACSGGSGSGGGGGVTATGSPVPADQIGKAYVQKLCAAIQPCCAQNGFADDFKTCEQGAAAVQAELDKERTEHPEYVYDAQKAGNCIAKMAAALSTCAPSKSAFDEDDDPDCEGLLRGNNTPGQSCKSSSDCGLGAYRSTCFRQGTSPSDEGVCIALKAPTEGDSCITTGVVPKADTTYASCGVDPTLQCDPETKACKKLVVKALGDACIGSGLECGSSAYCDSATKKCTARLKAGASCDPAATAACETRCDSDTKKCLTNEIRKKACAGSLG
ncbi:MAG: hypothetical protein IPG50_20345 [Myxococcales bacterium]|nr:hypothetical protein [Myxococcales bacterium]